MFEVPVAYAFLAGMAALLNPCGVAMLPAYVGYQMGQAETASSPSAVRALVRGTLVGLLATLGFVSIFGTIGAIIALGGRAVIAAMPYLGLGTGIAVSAVALWLILKRRHLGLMIASRVQWGQGRGVFGTFLFGVAYGLASLSCALPVFLVVVVSSMAVGGFGAAVGSFVSYAVGMGAMLLLISWGVATSQQGVQKFIHRAMPLIGPVGNVAMLGAGAYVIYYWTLGTGGQQLLFN